MRQGDTACNTNAGQEKNYLENKNKKTFTIVQFQLTVQQIFAETGWVLPWTQGLFDALDHAAQIAKSLKYLRVLVWEAPLGVLETLSKKGEDNTVTLLTLKLGAVRKVIVTSTVVVV